MRSSAVRSRRRMALTVFPVRNLEDLIREGFPGGRSRGEGPAYRVGVVAGFHQLVDGGAEGPRDRRELIQGNPLVAEWRAGRQRANP
jgi:hypothetical protein